MPQLLTPELDAAPLLALAGHWNLLAGEHPSLSAPLTEVLLSLPLFPTATEWQELSGLGLPISLTSHGHHTLADGGPSLATYPHRPHTVPLAPVFVRDLCGRVIHTGLLPLPTPPATPTFPAGCADVPASMGGAEYLEDALFTHFTLLEALPPSPTGPRSAANKAALLQAAYASPGAVPYKIRPHTFYADGWRLPQLNRVFARRVVGAEAQAETQAAALLQAWANRPADQDYEAFYEGLGGAAYMEELFLQGVTLIPTFEAYNGAFQVGADFTLQGVEAGRAVPGLHQIMAQQPSALPAGTILKVLAPGVVTATQVTPAQVVVSNGASLTPTDALLPNLSLPHPHVGGQWGACWLPTLSHHFAAPAIWDWLPSGHFAQVAGPLWCPQHYVYGSTAALVRATRRPHAGCPTLLQLPPSLKNRFAPVVALTYYDTINERTKAERLAASANAATAPLFGSALDSLPLAQTVAPVGYHPLPPHWPSLTQAAWFPGVAAPHNGSAPCPPELASQLAPIATPVLGAATLSKYHGVVTEPLRHLLSALHAPTTHNPSAPAWLPELPAHQIQLNVKRLFANRLYRASLTLQHGKLPEALFRFKEAALAWRRLRYRLVQKYPAALTHAECQHLSLESAENLAHTLPADAHTAAQAASAAQNTITWVPAAAATALHAAPRPAKVKPS